MGVCSVSRAVVTALVPSTDSADIALGLMSIAAESQVLYMGDKQKLAAKAK